MHIFISSTCYDLIDLRSELETFFREAGVAVKMSDRPSLDFQILLDQNSIETCLANVRDCDEFIIVLSQRYGPSLSKAGYDDVSATHLEYREAVNSKKPIRMYVRDRLEADHSVWKRNAGRADLELPWCKESHDRGLLQLLDEHSKLKAAEPRSNWIALFRDSVDLKQQLARDFRAAFARATVETLLKSGRVPFFEVTGQIRQYGNGSVQFALEVRNLGSVVALSPTFTFEHDATVHTLRSLAPQEQAHCQIECANFAGTTLTLSPMLSYSTVEGHKFVDHAKLTITYGRSGEKDAVGYELSERKYTGFSEKVLLKTN